MNTNHNLNYNKINKHREKIKLNIIEQNSSIIKQNKPINHSEYPITFSPLSRSNIKKNTTGFLNLSRKMENQHTNKYLEHSKISNQSQIQDQHRIQEPVRFQDRNQIEDIIRINQGVQIEEKSRIYEQNRIEPTSKGTENNGTISMKTIRKSLSSKSPSKLHPYLLQTAQITTKKKHSSKQNETLVSSALFDRTANFQNLSGFQTFNKKLTNPIFPPLYSQTSLSITTDQQIKNLLSQNQILSMHLNQKIERIKSLEKQLNAIIKSEILHEQKHDIERSNLTTQNQLIKRSTDQQVKILVLQIKKLNEQIFQKEQQWQQKITNIKKINLQQQQQAKKQQNILIDKHKTELQIFKINLASVHSQLNLSKQQFLIKIQNLQTQNINLNLQIQNLAHQHKIQKSQFQIQNTDKIKQIKEDFLKNIQLINLDKIKQQRQSQFIIDSLQKQNSFLNNKIKQIQQQQQFNEIKVLQQKGKLLIEIRDQKQKIQLIKQQENKKTSYLSKIQLQNAIQTYSTQISELNQSIHNLQQLVTAKNQELQNLYKEISLIRKNYQQELSAKEQHIQNLITQIYQLNQFFTQQQECFKIKLTQLTSTNQKSIQNIYQTKITHQDHLIIDKNSLIKTLKNQIQSLLQSNHQNHLINLEESKNYQIQIQQLKQQLSANILKEKTLNQPIDKESLYLKQNLLRQSQSYQKAVLVKDQSIQGLQKIIQTKDKQIEQLQKKLEILKRSHKQEVILIKQQHTNTVRQREDAIHGLKLQLEYSRREQAKHAQQFFHDKNYYSNQLRQLKDKGEKDFNQWIEKLSININELKVQNQHLKLSLTNLTNEYTEYKLLWNEEQSIKKLLDKEKQSIEYINQNFRIKIKNIRQQYEKEIQTNYKPKINYLQQISNQKEQQIIDMKLNYHQLQQKFQQLIQEKQALNTINEKVLTLGKFNNHLSQNFVTLNK